jgi:hypothetical protein
MFRRWLSSGAIYMGSEMLSSQITKKSLSKEDTTKVVVAGATADSILLRKFHFIIDKKFKSPLVRMTCEQIIVAPVYDSAYLMLRTNSWSFNEWWKIYKTDCVFWPFASFIGYKYVKTNHRFLYVSSMSMLWNTMRSTMISS